jgi:hypothetical protein
MDMAARILDKLRQSPFSVEELAVDLKPSADWFDILFDALSLLTEGSRFTMRPRHALQEWRKLIQQLTLRLGPSQRP